MKTISKLKSSVGKKGGSRTPVVKTTLITPSILRDKAKEDNEVAKLQNLLTERNRALEGTIDKKSKKLDRLNAEIVEKVEKAINSGQNIIEESKKRAKGILGDANKTKNESINILKRATSFEKELEQKNKDIEELSQTVHLARIDVSHKIAVIGEKEKEAENNLEITADKLQKIGDALVDIASLRAVASQVVESILSIYTDSADKVSQNQAKTDKIYVEVKKLESLVEADKIYNTKRAKELDKKEIWVKDRTDTLVRSEKEIEKRKRK